MKGSLAALLGALVLAGAAGAAGQEPRARVFNWRGDDLEHQRRGEVSITQLTNFWCQSDSLVVTAELAERRVDAAAATDEFSLRGNVVAVEGATRIVGETGHYDRHRDVATVSGAVTINDAATVIHCAEAVYERGAQLIHLVGDVDIAQGESRLRAQRVIYHRATGFAEAFDDVELSEQGGDTVLRGQHGSYDRERDQAEMDASPHLLRASAGDTVQVTAARMRQLRADSLAIAVGDVRYLRGPTEALCDSALFYQAEDRLLLFGEPRVLRSGSTLAGDTLELFFAGGEIQRMNINGRARFRDRPADTRVFPGQQSEIRGDRFRIHFRSGEISSVEVQGSPSSTYIPPLGADGRAAINEAAGDSMLLRFSADDLDEVRIFGSASGRYRYLDDWPARWAVADSAAPASRTAPPPASPTAPPPASPTAPALPRASRR